MMPGTKIWVKVYIGYIWLLHEFRQKVIKRCIHEDKFGYLKREAAIKHNFMEVIYIQIIHKNAIFKT